MKKLLFLILALSFSGLAQAQSIDQGNTINTNGYNQWLNSDVSNLYGSESPSPNVIEKYAVYNQTLANMEIGVGPNHGFYVDTFADVSSGVDLNIFGGGGPNTPVMAILNGNPSDLQFVAFTSDSDAVGDEPAGIVASSNRLCFLADIGGMGQPQPICFDNEGAHGIIINPIINETDSVADGYATLSHIPANIQNVYDATNNIPLAIVPSTATQATHQVKVNMTTGVLDPYAGDSVNSLIITYLPLISQ